MDRRTKQGKRSLNVWVDPDLGARLDKARGLIPMQRYVVFALNKWLATIEAEEWLATRRADDNEPLRKKGDI